MRNTLKTTLAAGLAGACLTHSSLWIGWIGRRQQVER